MRLKTCHVRRHFKRHPRLVIPSPTKGRRWPLRAHPAAACQLVRRRSRASSNFADCWGARVRITRAGLLLSTRGMGRPVRQASKTARPRVVRVSSRVYRRVQARFQAGAAFVRVQGEAPRDGVATVACTERDAPQGSVSSPVRVGMSCAWIQGGRCARCQRTARRCRRRGVSGSWGAPRRC